VIIDAHHHLWKHNDREYAWMSDERFRALRRDYLAKDLLEATRDSDVQGTVAVQARQIIAETEFLLDIASSEPLIRGVVGWIPLCASDVESHIERFSTDPKFKGVRHVLQDEPDDFFMLRDDFNCGVQLLKRFELVYEILIFERHLPQAIEFVDRHPNQVFVLDHVAKPRIKERVLSPWAERIRDLAKRENVYCKVSGMVTEADWHGWNAEHLRPYFEVVLAAFGPARLMFGSDWPVLTLASGYRAWVQTVQDLIADLSSLERDRILSGTAQHVYRL